MDSSNHEIELSINSNITVGLGDVCINNYRTGKCDLCKLCDFLKESSPYGMFVF